MATCSTRNDRDDPHTNCRLFRWAGTTLNFLLCAHALGALLSSLLLQQYPSSCLFTIFSFISDETNINIKAKCSHHLTRRSNCNCNRRLIHFDVVVVIIPTRRLYLWKSVELKWHAVFDDSCVCVWCDAIFYRISIASLASDERQIDAL